MVLRLFAETLLGSTLSITGLSKAEAVEKKLAGGKAFSVRAMISRQMLMALTAIAILPLGRVNLLID